MAKCVVALVALIVQAAPPALVVGAFKDDYNTTHTITAAEWGHGKAATFEIVEWHPRSEVMMLRQKNPRWP